jgi:hypothetical protein
MGSVPKWRIALAVVVLLVLGRLAFSMGPIYFRNLELRHFVRKTTSNPDSRNKSDEILRMSILDKSAALGLPVRPDNVKIERSPNALLINIRYVVRVNLPLYTVDLHFYPSAP